MRLGITSDCIHFITPDGKAGTENHILKRQLEALAVYFESVVICCPFVDFSNNVSYSIYDENKFRFIPSPKVGGNSFMDKIKLLRTIPTWLKLFKKIDKESDIVYQRFPNNLNIPGFFYFYIKRKKVFATFTGSWDKDPVASFSTRFQQFLLQKFFKGPIWVYTNSKQLKKNIFSGFSPSYTLKEWEEEVFYIEEKKFKKNSEKILKLISVGTLCERKNHSFILHTCVMLKKAHIPFHLAIAGSGERIDEYKKFIAENDLQQEVELKGSVHYEELRNLYRQYDYVVQSPTSEAYGKVPIEGYFHGLIPVLSSASILANYITNYGKRGFIFDLKDRKSLFRLLQYLYREFSETEKINMIDDGRMFVKNLTIDEWAKDYFEKISNFFPQVVKATSSFELNVEKKISIY
jgi:glycosyltransferase involved in cell wall biosynthesis